MILAVPQAQEETEAVLTCTVFHHMHESNCCNTLLCEEIKILQICHQLEYHIWSPIVTPRDFLFEFFCCLIVIVLVLKTKRLAFCWIVSSWLFSPWMIIWKVNFYSAGLFFCFLIHTTETQSVNKLVHQPWLSSQVCQCIMGVTPPKSIQYKIKTKVRVKGTPNA